MRMNSHDIRRVIALTVLAAGALTFAGCDRVGTGSSAGNHGNNSSTAELFTIPADQMAHVQVLGKLADVAVRLLERWTLSWHPAFQAAQRS